MYKFAVANGVPFDKVTSTGIKPSRGIETLGSPRYRIKSETWKQQSDLFRLSGDYNQLHIGRSTFLLML
jgi:hypothetical protein